MTGTQHGRRRRISGSASPSRTSKRPLASAICGRPTSRSAFFPWSPLSAPSASRALPASIGSSSAARAARTRGRCSRSGPLMSATSAPARGLPSFSSNGAAARRNPAAACSRAKNGTSSRRHSRNRPASISCEPALERSSVQVRCDRLLVRAEAGDCGKIRRGLHHGIRQGPATSRNITSMASAVPAFTSQGRQRPGSKGARRAR